MTDKLTHWFEPRSRTIYHVRGVEMHERMRDIVRGARFQGIRIYAVKGSWVGIRNKSDPFAKEVDLIESLKPTRITHFSETLKQLHK